ncbi:MAG: MFS transporter, partial [Acidimicrobiia bacterium]
MGDRAGGAFRSLNIRSFRLFFFGQLISQVGSWLTIVALTLVVLRRTDSGVAVGALVACQYGPMLVLGAYGGLVVDRSDKRRLLILTQVLQMVQSFVLAWLASIGDAPLGAFYAAAFAGGALMAFDNPARRSFVTEMVPPEEMHNAVTLNSALMTSARVVGPALGGVSVSNVGFSATFTIDAFSYVAVIASYGAMRSAELHVTDRGAKGKGQVRAALRYIKSVPELYVPMVMVTIIGLCSYNFAVMIPLFVVRSLHRSDSTYTALYTVLSVGSLAAALVTARSPNADLQFAVRWAYGFGVSLLLLAAAP